MGKLSTIDENDERCAFSFVQPIIVLMQRVVKATVTFAIDQKFFVFVWTSGLHAIPKSQGIKFLTFKSCHGGKRGLPILREVDDTGKFDALIASDLQTLRSCLNVSATTK